MSRSNSALNKTNPEVGKGPVAGFFLFKVTGTDVLDRNAFCTTAVEPE